MSSEVVTDFRDKLSRDRSREIAKTQHKLSTATETYSSLQSVVLKARADYEEITSKLVLLRNEERNLTDKVDELQHTDAAILGIPLAAKLARIQQLQQQLSALHDVIKTQEAAETTASKILNKAEHDVGEADIALSRLRDRSSGLAVRQLAELRNEALIASRRKQVELQHVAEKEMRRTAEAAASAALEEEEEAEFERRLENTIAERQKAAVLTKSSTMVAKEVSDVIQAIEADDRDRKVASLLQLKADLDEARATVNSQVQSRRAAEQAREAAYLSRKSDLEAAGKNPKEVFLVEEREQRLQLAKEKHLKSVAKAELTITAKLLHEDKRAVEAEEANQAAVQAEEEFKSHMTRGVRERKTEAFIRARVTHGGALIDATGRAPNTQPSEVTQVIPAGFGLGKLGSTRRDILETVKLNATKAGLTIPATTRDKRKDAAESDDFAGLGGTMELEDGAEDSLPDDNSETSPSSPKPKYRSKADLSLYERKLMDEALERQRTGMVVEQVVAGRHFKGPGFSCTPSSLDFIDFDVDVPQTVHAKITNISFSFNSFRLEPLPDDIRDMFDIVFVPPGRMSAGISIPLSITFTPRRNRDIDSNLVILAQTGRVEIPLRCRTKKAVPALSSSALQLGDVMLGDSITGTVTLSNAGAIPFQAFLSSGGDAGVLHFPQQVSVEAYGSCRIPVRYTPKCVENRTDTVDITFDKKLEPFVLTVHATCKDVALYVEENSIDFQTCVVDKIYRATLVLRNRSNVAMKCGVVLDETLLEYGAIEVSPNFGFVMAHNSALHADGALAFAVKLTISEQFHAYLRSTERHGVGLYTFDMKLVAPDQTLPIPFNIRFRVTENSVSATPEAVDFGTVSELQVVSRKVSIRNDTVLPQQVMLTCSKPEFSISAKFGSTHVILPQSSLEVPLEFRPMAAVNCYASLEVESTMYSRLSVPLVGKGSPAVLKIATPSIVMGATPVRHAQETSVLITNVAKQAVVFEVLPPLVQEGGSVLGTVTVSPQVGKLDAQSSARLLVTYDPPAEAEAPSSQSNEWVIPIAAKTSDESLFGSAVFSVCTTFTPPALDVSPGFLSFGEVPCGQSKILSVEVRNDSDVPMQVICHLSDAFSAYSLLAVPRTLAPHTYDSLVVAFKPTARLKYPQLLTVRAENMASACKVVLNGEGVSPSLRFAGGNVEEVDFSATLVGERSVRQLVLENTSPFPVTFNIKQVFPDIQLQRGEVVIPAFSVDPVAKTIAAGDSCKLSVTFSPLVQYDGVSNKFVVEVPGQDTSMYLAFKTTGRSFDRTYFLSPVTPHIQALSLDGTDSFTSAMDAASLRSVLGTATGDAPLSEAQYYRITFPAVEVPDKAPAAAKDAAGDKAKPVAASAEPQLVETINVVPFEVEKPGDGSKPATATSGTKPKAGGAAPAATKSTGGSSGGSGGAISYQVTLSAAKGEEDNVQFFSVEQTSGSIGAAPQPINFRFHPFRNSASAQRLPEGIAAPVRTVRCQAKVAITGGLVAKGANNSKVVCVDLVGMIPFTM